MMARVCKVCTHPKRKAIESKLAANVTYCQIAAEYGMSNNAVKRHKETHSKLVIQQAVERNWESMIMGVQETMARISINARRNIRPVFNKWGAIRDINELSEDEASLIKGIKRKEIYMPDPEDPGDPNSKGGKSIVGEIVEVSFVDAAPYLRMLAQHHQQIPTLPPPIQQTNIQQNIFVRSPEELEYFIANGHWPEITEQADQGRSGSAGTLVRCDGPGENK
jgi:hypothetical protein